MPPKLRPNGHVWADGEKGPGPQTMKEVCCWQVAVGWRLWQAALERCVLALLFAFPMCLP